MDGAAGRCWKGRDYGSAEKHYTHPRPHSVASILECCSFRISSVHFCFWVSFRCFTLECPPFSSRSPLSSSFQASIDSTAGGLLHHFHRSTLAALRGDRAESASAVGHHQRGPTGVWGRVGAERGEMSPAGRTQRMKTSGGGLGGRWWKCVPGFLQWNLLSNDIPGTFGDPHQL